MAVLRAEADGSGIRIDCRVQPRASKNAVAGLLGERLKVCVGSAPVDGRANAAVCEVLADFFGVSKGRVEVKNGLTSRNKSVAVKGLNPADAERKLRELQGKL